MRTSTILNNERGTALIETIPLLVIFVVFMSFGLGIFGIIHTATLNSIGSRAYSFDSFRQRTNLQYYREDQSGLIKPLNYSVKGWRAQAIQDENDGRLQFVATPRPVSMGNAVTAGDNSVETHNVKIYSMNPRNQTISVNPAWVMVAYGICINATCGGN